ncbi:hypothetical protein [Brachybacterium hainanense]|uniref:Uncharacterized protein n=1 Tax=Brachybacterium hainanense TaxID=1541174 RepID=A0ABV6R662_9MICO
MLASPPPDRPVSRPTPRALQGRRDPAARVRPVDWAATGRSDAAAAEPPSASLPRRRARTLELPRPQAPEQPGYADRPLRIVEDDLRVVGAEEATQEQIVLAVADPEDAWTADAGVSDHFQRGDLTVQVRRLDNAVIGVFATRYALSVRPEEFERTPETAMLAAGPSARRGLGTRHPTTRRELLARMEEAGFVIAPGSTHGRVSHPEHPGLFVPMASTPSDVRFTRHAVAQIRRVFGIDLRR